MKAKKSLGQNFLHNTAILQKMVLAAEITPEDLVLEIGPGTGTLTDEILKTGARIIAVEKDDTFAENLKTKYIGKNIEIVHEDILTFQPSLVIRHSNFVIVGNIPYYLTGHLLRLMLTTWPPFKVAVLMVQKEVAKRMIAKPPEMNMLAVLTQCYTKAELVQIVKRGNFVPVPKVDSAIVKLTPSQPPPRGEVKVGVLELAAKGFQHPRKKLANNLPKELLEQAGIEGNRRAETISLDEWKKISQTVV